MKIKDITPASFTCLPDGCPAIFETDRQTYLIIGRRLDPPDELLAGKVGQDEIAIEVPQELLLDLLLKRQP